MPTVPLVNTILGESFRALAEVLGCYFLLKNVFEKMGRGLFDLSAKRFRVLGEVQVLLFSFQNVFRLEERLYLFHHFPNRFFTLLSTNPETFPAIRYVLFVSFPY